MKLECFRLRPIAQRSTALSAHNISSVEQNLAFSYAFITLWHPRCHPAMLHEVLIIRLTSRHLVLVFEPRLVPGTSTT